MSGDLPREAPAHDAGLLPAAPERNRIDEKLNEDPYGKHAADSPTEVIATPAFYVAPPSASRAETPGRPEAPFRPAEPAGAPPTAWRDPNSEWNGAHPRTEAIGEPGAAAKRVVPRPPRSCPDVHGLVLDEVRVAGPEGGHSVDVRAASVRGLSHKYYERPREDDFAFRVTPDDSFVVLAVADGVSGGTESAYAARTAVDTACEVLAEHLGREGEPDQLAWPDLVERISQAVEDDGRLRLPAGAPATRRDVARHMAATLVVAVADLRPDEQGVFVRVARVGDASAMLLAEGRSWRRLLGGSKHTDGPADSTTAAVPCAPATGDTWSYLRVVPGEALVLITDGIDDPLGDGRGEVGRRLAEAWAQPPPVLDFAAQVGFARKTFDDDRTAVVLWPRPARRR